MPSAILLIAYHIFRLFFFLFTIRLPHRSTLFPYSSLFFFNDTATTEMYTLSSHLGISYAVFCLKKKDHRCALPSRRQLLRLHLVDQRQLCAGLVRGRMSDLRYTMWQPAYHRSCFSASCRRR